VAALRGGHGAGHADLAGGLAQGAGNDSGNAGVRVTNISEDQTPGRRVHDPKHPQADADGYVTYSNVNTVEEMVNMISASRSYQNNIEVMSTAKSLLLKTLQLGQS
jgi:flagellar basal-body rod protein FlgC